MIRRPALTDVLGAVVGAVMLGWAAHGARPRLMPLLAVGGIALVVAAATRFGSASVAAAGTAVVLIAGGGGDLLLSGPLVLAYLLLSADPRPPLLGVLGAAVALSVATAVVTLPARASLWLVLAAFAAAPVAVHLALRTRDVRRGPPRAGPG